MRINPSRSAAAAIRYVLDELLPPALRDSPLLMRPVFRSLFGADAETFLRFKECGLSMSPEEFLDTYRRSAAAMIDRPTDLNPASTERILAALRGRRVLEVGAGRGYLAERMAARGVSVTATDIDVSRAAPVAGVEYRQAWADALPFPDASFGTVVCTHTLEHVQRLGASLAELRRVASHRLIIVVPRQRPYRYTFDLHLHFFPYEFSLRGAFHAPDHATCEDVGADWFYVEDRAAR